jgi:hypothetical protein
MRPLRHECRVPIRDRAHLALACRFARRSVKLPTAALNRFAATSPLKQKQPVVIHRAQVIQPHRHGWRCRVAIYRAKPLIRRSVASGPRARVAAPVVNTEVALKGVVMPIHVDEMVSEVTAESDSPAAGASEPTKWDEKARAREAQAQIARDRFRTAAEGYDD